MAIPFSFTNPTTFTSPFLIGENTQVTGGSVDGLPSFTTSGGVPGSIALELQSTTSAFLATRLTTTQKNAMVTPIDGMLLYDSTLGKLQGREGGAWITLSNSAGGVFVADVGSAAAPSYTFTGDLDTGIYHPAANTVGISAGGLRQAQISSTASAVNYLDLTGSATGTNPIISVLGTDTNIGLDLKSKGTGVVNFFSNGAVQARVSPTATAVNFIDLTGGATGQDPILGVGGSDTNVGLDVVLKGTGAFNLKGDTDNGEIRFWNTANTFYISLSCENPTANLAFTLPDAYPTTGQTPITVDSLGAMRASSIGPIIFTTATTLTASDITGMYATPHLLLPAPGAGKILNIHDMRLKFIYAGAAFASGGAIGPQYGNAAHLAGPAAGSQVTSAFLTTAASQFCGVAGTGPETDLTNVTDVGIYLTNDTGAFTGGAGGTVVIEIWYSIISAT